MDLVSQIYTKENEQHKKTGENFTRFNVYFVSETTIFTWK